MIMINNTVMMMMMMMMMMIIMTPLQLDTMALEPMLYRASMKHPQVSCDWRSGSRDHNTHL